MAVGPARYWNQLRAQVRGVAPRVGGVVGSWVSGAGGLLISPRRTRALIVALSSAGVLVVVLALAVVDAHRSSGETRTHADRQPAAKKAPATALGPLTGSSGAQTSAPRTVPPTTTPPPAQAPKAVSYAAPSALAAGGIPSTALTAYRHAAQLESAKNPSCRLPWPLLAGIGRVESDHGRFAGAVLHADGVSTPAIIGIPLNGHGTALIRDTDKGALDGDVIYDRAVGSMQFIPSTWATWGRDANGDGKRDPFNIIDAAAAAADYLCAAGGDLGTYQGQVAAVLSYNHSTSYLKEVLGLEKIYAHQVGVTIPVIPTDPTPGGDVHPKLPPVDPGAPGGGDHPSAGTGTSSTAPSSPGSSGRAQPTRSSGPGRTSSGSRPTHPSSPGSTTSTSSAPSCPPTGTATGTTSPAPAPTTPTDPPTTAPPCSTSTTPGAPSDTSTAAAAATTHAP